jgi:hypothetical protein
MAQASKQQSNPFSTGGGGPNFETRVQAAFAILMLSGRLSPCLPPFPIEKIKLQARYAGYSTDDFVVFARQQETGKEAKLLVQAKHSINITAGDSTFSEVIKSTWNDFNDKTFDSCTDALALITGPLNTTDTKNVRPILEWARYSENSEEFFIKVNTAHFSSKAKRDKLEAFRTQLKKANNDQDVPDERLWEYLKAFHLIGYDLDTASGSTLSLIYSLITFYSNEDAPSIWSRVVDIVQGFNQNAGTITLKTLPDEIKTVFSTETISSQCLSDISRLKEHGNVILDRIGTTVGGCHISRSNAFAELIDLAESSKFVLVSGTRGVGKSSLVKEFAQHVGEDTPSFCLRMEDLNESHLDKVFSLMGLRSSLLEMDASFVLMPKKYLFIESLEKLLEVEQKEAFADLLHFIAKQKGWTVIATCRDYAYQQIAFSYPQLSEIGFETLTISDLNDEQIDQLCQQVETLQTISENLRLRPLLKSPFFADLAYRALQNGAKFRQEDGEKEFRAAVWRNVIAKEDDRKNGMPIKRKQTFIDIAVTRAKRMSYGIPVAARLDSDALLKLEEDNLIRRSPDDGLLSPEHDVLEDWALDQYIEDVYQENLDDIQKILHGIGHEPALNRAFRLWLHQKMRGDESIDDFVISIISDQGILQHWKDATIAALLQGDNPEAFLKRLKQPLFSDDGALLKRFCFILRIACQTPNQSSGQRSDQNVLIDSLLLKPYGPGWDAVICFLLANKECLEESLVPHVVAVMTDWSNMLRIDEQPSPPAREAGLLSIYLLEELKASYSDDGDRKKLLRIIIKASSVIREEFLHLLETDIFAVDKKSRLPYVKDFCKMLLQDTESVFFWKGDPDTVIKLAHAEWIIVQSENKKPSYRNITEIDSCFGLRNKYDYNFSPASGIKGPFRSLLNYHPKKGLDFLLDFCNVAADNYAHSDLDAPSRRHGLSIRNAETLIDPVEICLNDGSTIMQYCSDRLWRAYRGQSVFPDVLQSALMAFENWVIDFVEQSESDQIEWLFDYVLRKSNSVMTTAVLASIATGFPIKAGKYAMPILRVPELFHLDLVRTIHERGESGSNWHRSAFSRETLAELYAQERHTAAIRPWRKESLESLIFRLQYSEWRDEALVAVDAIRSSKSQDERTKFLLARIDTRELIPIEDKENNIIIFESRNPDPDLEAIQKQTQESTEINGRFSRLYLWSEKIFKQEELGTAYYENWQDALAESKALLAIVKADTGDNTLFLHHFNSIVTAAAIFIRDNSEDLDEGDAVWCINLIVSTIRENSHKDDASSMLAVIDFDGISAAASVLPVLLDFTSTDEEKQSVHELIATVLTLANEKVRNAAAEGIRKYLWQRDPEFAQQCVMGAIEYAAFQQQNSRDYSNLEASIQTDYYGSDFEDDNRSNSFLANLRKKEDEFRTRLVNKDFPAAISESMTLQEYSAWHILSPCLMIPNASREPEHVKLFSNMLTLFFENEKEENDGNIRNNRFRIGVDTWANFSKRFSNYLLGLESSSFEEYADQLRVGCEQAPEFMSFLLLCFAVAAEQEGRKEVYWVLWNELSSLIQEMSISMIKDGSRLSNRDSKRKLLRRILELDVEWTKSDYENQNISLGKDLLLEFAENVGKNPDVFEALTSWMYHFPSIFFERGLHILSKHQEEIGGISLFRGINTAFYIERSIQRFLQVDHPGLLSKRAHKSCLILLNAVVETASSRAYYLREHLIRSRKTL